ncbi:MAG TPA: HD domain-containing phosphohydrolase [Gallionellaceae bacterium]
MDQDLKKSELRILMLEDTPTDAELAERELRKAGIAFTALRVDRKEAFIHALSEFHPDLILSDYRLPDFNGLEALQLVRRDFPYMPVIMVTGALSDIEAVELITAGAKDYVLKDRLARLAPAVQRVLSMEQGIRARKAAEQALRDSEEKFRSLVESTSDWIWETNEHDAYTYSSPRVYELLGYAADEVIGKSPFDLMPRDEAMRVRALLDSIKTGNKSFWLLENTNLHKDGRLIVMESSGIPILDSRGIFKGYRGISRDITERKQAETTLQRLNRALKALSSGNHTLVRSRNEADLMQGICRAITEGNTYLLAWVGRPLQDAGKTVQIVANAGAAQSYLGELRISWDDVPTGRGPTGTALRTGQVQISQDIARDARMEPWRKLAAKYGLASSIALPLRDNGQVVGVLTLYAGEPNAFDTEEVALLEEMAEDLAYGLDALHTRIERDRALDESRRFAERLRSSLEEALQAISATVEMRDPYTAGHQRRVAQLAAEIARVLGLPEEKVHGIRLASIVHDLGKIHIPAEILSKPSTLNEIEFSLIKTHPQAGYDILAEIDFPWPIAQTVLQHHERVDGSGYPHGLKGDAIIPEARILAVADVVEAMSSHRPYRPGLGIEAALEEIERHRGTRYDTDAADACIRLFRQRQYKLPN